MPIEQAKIGQVAARLMERLEQEYETDESAEVSSVNLISAVRHDAGERLTFISTRAHAWHSPRVCGWSRSSRLDLGSEEVTEAIRYRQCGVDAS